jgi:hypothetical protein
MDDEAPNSLNLKIEAFRAIAAAVTEAEIGGEVGDVTISQMKPNLELMRDALAIEVTVGGGQGGGGRRETWIVAGDGRVVAHLDEQREDADPD